MATRDILEKTRRALFQEIPIGRPAGRLVDIDAARGLAIILVVIGHITSGKMPADNEWYLTLMALIYQFHMPLFMVLTGVTFALSLPTVASWSGMRAFSLRRVARLMVPYLLMGSVILIGKSVAIHFVHVDNPPSASLDEILALILVPGQSVARFLWFVYVLAIYSILIPLLFCALGRRPMLLFLMALLLQLGTWPPILALDRAIYYLPFFSAGMVLWIHRLSWSPLRPWVFWTSAAAFASILAFSPPLQVPRWLVGASSFPAVLGSVQRLPSGLQSALGWLGQYSLSIYLFNGMAMGIVRGLILKVASWDGVYFFLFFPLLLLAGVAIPLAIKRLATQWVPGISRYL